MESRGYIVYINYDTWLDSYATGSDVNLLVRVWHIRKKFKRWEYSVTHKVYLICNFFKQINDVYIFSVKMSYNSYEQHRSPT